MQDTTFVVLHTTGAGTGRGDDAHGQPSIGSISGRNGDIILGLNFDVGVQFLIRAVMLPACQIVGLERGRPGRKALSCVICNTLGVRRLMWIQVMS